MLEKDRDGATESLIHKHCLRLVLNCDHLKHVNSSKVLGAVGVPKTGKLHCSEHGQLTWCLEHVEFLSYLIMVANLPGRGSKCIVSPQTVRKMVREAISNPRITV